MSALNELIIRIKDDGNISVEENIDGVVSFKFIEPDSLLDCINKSLFRGGVSSGLLPKSCLSLNIHDNSDREITILHTEDRANISYMGTEYKDFPIPRLVFGFRISGEGRISNCRLGIIGTETNLKPKTPMFYYPFSNVHNNHLCIGNNPLPKVKSLHTLGSLAYHILSMDNNNHSFSPLNNKQGLEMRDLLEMLKDKQQSYYYEHILVPSRQTLGDFI
jgi:hypothetical protein